jgi:hypothetical protein
MMSCRPCWLVARGAEHAHGVIVGQRHVLDRLVGDLAHAAHHVLGHHRRRRGVDDHHGVVADDHAGIGIAFRRIGIGVVGELFEADLFLLQVGVGGKLLFAHDSSSGKD